MDVVFRYLVKLTPIGLWRGQEKGGRRVPMRLCQVKFPGTKNQSASHIKYDARKLAILSTWQE